MKRRNSSSDSDGRRAADSQEQVNNIRSRPPHIFDNITHRLLQLGVTLAITTFVGLIVRYAVQEFDPAVQTITVTTSRVDNRDVAQLSVSKHFLERILEFVEESVAIAAAIIPLGFPLCTLANRHFAKLRAGLDKVQIHDHRVLSMIPRYVLIGDTQACQLPSSNRLRPLVRDTIYQLIKVQLKPKLIVEDSFEEARRLGIRIGLIRRHHHRLAVIKSVDLLKNITDSRGDIKPAKVRYLLSRMKIMSQATPADKSLLAYLIKHCEPEPNENLAYLGYTFTDPEAMRAADCALTFQDCDDEDVKRQAQVTLKSNSMTFTDLYLLLIVCLLSSNIVQSYALYQISASVSCCLYRFLSITVFQDQLLDRSQFALLLLLQQVFAIMALMTKWLSSLPQAPLHSASLAELSHAATDEATLGETGRTKRRARSSSSLADGLESGASSRLEMQPAEDTSPSSASSPPSSAPSSESERAEAGEQQQGRRSGRRKSRQRKLASEQHIHLSGIDLDKAVINSKLVTSYKQTFHYSKLIDDVTYRLARLHIAYQLLVMIIIMIFGNAMFQLNVNNNRQHQTLALNSLIMNNIFNLANCFNQFGRFNLSAGFRDHPFLICVLLLALFLQVSLTELNAFGLENLNPIQWFVCLVFALLSALIAPLTGQQQRQRAAVKLGETAGEPASVALSMDGWQAGQKHRQRRQRHSQVAKAGQPGKPHRSGRTPTRAGARSARHVSQQARRSHQAEG